MSNTVCRVCGKTMGLFHKWTRRDENFLCDECYKFLYEEKDESASITTSCNCPFCGERCVIDASKSTVNDCTCEAEYLYSHDNEAFTFRRKRRAVEDEEKE